MSLKTILAKRVAKLATIEKHANELKEIEALLSTECARIDGAADKAFWRAMNLAVAEGKSTIDVSEVVEAAVSTTRRSEVAAAIRERFTPKQVRIAKTDPNGGDAAEPSGEQQLKVDAAHCDVDRPDNAVGQDGSMEGGASLTNDPEGSGKDQRRHEDNLEREDGAKSNSAEEELTRLSGHFEARASADHQAEKTISAGGVEGSRSWKSEEQKAEEEQAEAPRKFIIPPIRRPLGRA